MAGGESEKQHRARRFPGEVVIYRDGRFIGWSIAEQRPLYYNRNPSDFHKTLSAEHGPYSGFLVSARMKTAMRYGSSLGPSITPEEIVKGNQLGAQSDELTLEQIFAEFSQEGLSEDLRAVSHDRGDQKSRHQYSDLER